MFAVSHVVRTTCGSGFPRRRAGSDVLTRPKCEGQYQKCLVLNAAAVAAVAAVAVAAVAVAVVGGGDGVGGDRVHVPVHDPCPFAGRPQLLVDVEPVYHAHVEVLVVSEPCAVE